jgi:DNA-binding response OmpR family regulator
MSKRILAIDDNPYILETLDEILRYYGYDIKLSSNAENIFDQIADFNPNLILLDVMLDGRDGRDLCRLIKNDPNTCHLPIILISATPGVSENIHEEGGADDYVAKPFDIYKLLEKVEKYTYVS